MGKNTKVRFENFAFYNYDGTKLHLEKMALKGWKLKKIKQSFWTYEKIEPQKLRYDIAYLSGKSQLDKDLTEEQEVFIDYCTQSGWEFVAGLLQMQIFVSQKEDITPIETDPSLKLVSIHKTMKKTIVLSYFMLIFLAVMQLFMQLSQGVTYLFSHYIPLILVTLWVMLCVMCSTSLWEYYYWYLKSKKRIDCGEQPLSTAKYHFAHTYLATMLSVIVLFASIFVVFTSALSLGMNFVVLLIVYIVTLIGGTIGIKFVVKKTNLSVKKKWITISICCIALFFLAFGGMTWGVFASIDSGNMGIGEPVRIYTTTNPQGEEWEWEVYHDDIPLKIEDITPTQYENYSYNLEESKTIFLSETIGRQGGFPDGEESYDLVYTILDVSFSPLFHSVLNERLQAYAEWNHEMEKSYYELIDQKAWGADTVYQLYNWQKLQEITTQPKYIIVKDKKIVDIQLDTEPTQAQIDMIMEKLF